MESEIASKIASAWRDICEAEEELRCAMFSMLHDDELQAANRVQIAAEALTHAAKILMKKP